MANPGLDREALHLFLFERTDDKDIIRIVQKELADDLGVTPFTMNRVIKEFCQEGRLKTVTTSNHNIQSYVVCEPAAWHNGEVARNRKKLLWG